MSNEDLKSSDYDNYEPKCVPASSIGFIQYEIQSIEHKENSYRITFRDGLLAPGVVMPDNLGFKPEKDMKVIWDSDAGVGAEGYLSFYDKQGKQLCALHKERMSKVWQNITQELADQELRKGLGLPENMTFTPKSRQEAERIYEEYGRMPTPDEIDAKFKAADKLEQEAQQLKKEATGIQGIRNALISSKLRKIRRHYGYMQEDKEALTKSEGEEAEELKAGIQKSRDEMEKAYEKVNPELAALRKQEKDGTITTKERREAVKAYYNKKTQRNI